MNFFIYVVIRMKICYVASYISMRTTALAENSMVARMERLVEVAQSSRSKTQRLIDACAKYYTPGTPARSPPETIPVSRRRIGSNSAEAVHVLLQPWSPSPQGWLSCPCCWELMA